MLPKDMTGTDRKYKKIHTADPLAAAAPETRARVEQMLDYIMKHCLWQFNSRGWDRRKQNAGVLGKTTQILCGEEIDNPTPLERCYWVDAVTVAKAFGERCPWLAGLEPAAIKELMQALHARLDWLTIDGSLNEELTVQQY